MCYSILICNDKWWDSVLEIRYKWVIVIKVIYRCGACKGFVSSFNDLSIKYSNAVFLSVDVEKCEGTGLHYRVNAMPTFVLIRNKQKLDQIEGANKDALETKIKAYYTDAGADNCGVKGMVSTKKYCLLHWALSW